MAEERDNPGGISAPPPLIYAGGLLIGLLFERRFPTQLSVPRAAPRLVGGLLLGGGSLLAGWFSRAMRRAETPFRLDQSATELVTHGPFRYSRNPGYLSFAFIYAGFSILRNSPWSMLLLPTVLFVVQRQVIRGEERYLERAFGEEYRCYKARTRRWV